MGTALGRWGRALAAGLVAFAVSSSASAVDAKRIAVRAFAAKGVSSGEASTLESEFCAQLDEAYRGQGFSILCSEELKSLIAHQQFAMSLGKCEDDESCTKQIVEASEAGVVISGEVSRLGDLFVVSVVAMDTATGKTKARASEKTAKVEDFVLKGLIGNLAKKIAAAK